MTHLVLGYPSFDDNYALIEKMNKAGVELVELQFPFSEPMADGPVIMRANHRALEKGVAIKGCFDFAKRVTGAFPEISFLIMTYYNILFAQGEEDFISRSKASDIKGFIIPDLPPEEGKNYISICRRENLDPVFIFTPTNKTERLKKLAQASSGFIYTVGRRGVTGPKTSFGRESEEVINRYRQATDLPLAMGFGLREKSDVDFLKGRVEIAVIGTKLLQVTDSGGVDAAQGFLTGLR